MSCVLMAWFEVILKISLDPLEIPLTFVRKVSHFWSSQEITILSIDRYKLSSFDQQQRLRATEKR